MNMIRVFLFFTGLFVASTIAWGEPLFPLLSSRSVDSLHTLLATTRHDTQRVTVLLALSADLITRHEEFDTDLGHAYDYAKQAAQLSQQVHFSAGQLQSAAILGRLEAFRGNRAGAEQMLRKVLDQYTRQKKRTEQAATWYFLGQLYERTKEELPPKIHCYEQAMRLYRQEGLVVKQAYMLKMIADMHALQGNPTLAEQELLQVLALYRSIHYPQLHYTYDLLGSIHHGLNNYDTALKYALLALESAQVTQDSTYLGSFNLSLAVLYDELKQWKTAIPYYQKALVLFGKSHALQMVHVIAHSLCSLQIAHESPAAALAYYTQILKQYPLPNRPAEQFYAYMTLAECHVALRHYKLAENYYIKLVSLQAGNTLDNATIASYIKIGTFYVVIKKYDKARTYLNHALALLKQAGLTRGTPSVHLQLFKLDSAQHNYPAAIGHYQKYKALSDSIFNEKKSQQIANLEIQYNTRKKEQDIALLTRQNQLQQARIRASNLQRNSFVAGAILLALLLVLFYNRYRLKQRSNRLLEAKQLEINLKNESLVQILLEKEKLLDEKEWMLKEIHHRVKNNLQIITSMLNAQSDFLQDPQAILAIRDSQNRVHAMALIHQRLYQSESLAQVSMPEFVEEIVAHLIDSFADTDVTIIRSECSVAPLWLDIALAIPIGLILNEAVTNSLKYAFPAWRSGCITVQLVPIAAPYYQLTISDNGVGLPTGFNSQRSDTLGLTMIRGLSQQIGAELSMVDNQGVHIQLRFNPARKSS